MNRLILTAGLCLIVATLASSYNLMCFYTNWSQYRSGDGNFRVSDIDPHLCTHLMYAFADINGVNELQPTETGDIQNYLSFNRLKDRNQKLKTLLSVGGWNAGTQFSTMVSTPTNRLRFIKSSIALLRKYNFDGINLDWEYPGKGWNHQQNKKRFTLLVKELRAAYEAEGTANNRPRLLVTAAVAAPKAIIDASYEVAEIAKYLDFMNVMTFDLHGVWDWATGHHSPLFKRSHETGDRSYLNADYAMRYLQSQGVPAEKLILGFAAYGRTFTLSTQSSGVGAPISGAGIPGPYTQERGFWSYYEVCHLLEGKSVKWIEDQKVPYGVTGNQWVGFDNKDSIDAKIQYITENNFGGVFVWSLDLDDFRGLCNQGKYPLISHLNSLLVSDQAGSETPATATTTSTTTTTTTTAAATTDMPATNKNVATTSNTPATTTGAATTNMPATNTDVATTTPLATTTAAVATTNMPATNTDVATTTPLATTTGAATTNMPATNTDVATTTTTTTIAATTITMSATKSIEDFCEGKTSGIYSNPNDQSSFIQCVHGMTYVTKCFPGLVYQDACKCCNWP